MNRAGSLTSCRSPANERKYGLQHQSRPQEQVQFPQPDICFAGDFPHAFQLIDGNRNREPLFSLFGSSGSGKFPVDGFFLLSGYLIVQSWDAAPREFPFLAKRVFRIYPGFVLASLICAFVVGPLGAEPAVCFDQLNDKLEFTGLPGLWGAVTPAVSAGTPYPSVNGSMRTVPYALRTLRNWRSACDLRGKLPSLPLPRRRARELLKQQSYLKEVLKSQLIHSADAAAPHRRRYGFSSHNLIAYIAHWPLRLNNNARLKSLLGRNDR